MPHKVHSVLGHVQNAGGIEKSRDEIDATAGAIQAVYDDVEERGGQIIGSHVVPGELATRGGGELGRISGYVIYLVEHLPGTNEVEPAE